MQSGIATGNQRSNVMIHTLPTMFSSMNRTVEHMERRRYGMEWRRTTEE